MFILSLITLVVVLIKNSEKTY
ncbi:hypothetical protein [Leuconostoc mesenteroides]|nr:hypothetical protein [Leuconostoc mesenteroides]